MPDDQPPAGGLIPADATAAGLILAQAVEAVLEEWITGWVARFDAAAATSTATTAAIEMVRTEVLSELRSLLTSDIDEQRATPLGVLRRAIAVVSDVLLAAGAKPPQRDPYDEQRFPEDVFGLNPATWSDIHPELVEPGLHWSVAKAFEHRRRHRSGGSA